MNVKRAAGQAPPRSFGGKGGGKGGYGGSYGGGGKPGGNAFGLEFVFLDQLAPSRVLGALGQSPASPSGPPAGAQSWGPPAAALSWGGTYDGDCLYIYIYIYIYIYMCVAFCGRFFMLTIFTFFGVCRSDHPYKYLSWRHTHLLCDSSAFSFFRHTFVVVLRFSGSTQLKTTAGVNSSMPVFHLGASRLRFGASRSRLDVTRDASGSLRISGSHWRALDATSTRRNAAGTSLGEKHAC